MCQFKKLRKSKKIAEAIFLARFAKEIFEIICCIFKSECFLHTERKSLFLSPDLTTV
jgi:hypothetical protein